MGLLGRVSDSDSHVSALNKPYWVLSGPNKIFLFKPLIRIHA
jgi:hypothetical protein